ncbi:hypothetical protein EI94DRAFT_1748173 [Lactarius quietus]|nr:hypothetical protein EI94DRAFT_1748173 [Lactarius quietus]
MDARPPPLGVKLTGYRLLFIATVFSFGTVKGILTYMGQSIAPNTLDWVSGTLLAVVLYWIGLYEERDSYKWRWFFKVDLSPAIGHYAKRVVGGAMWPLLLLGRALRIVLWSLLLFFQVDFAPAMGYFAKRGVGGFFGLLLFFDNPYRIVFAAFWLACSTVDIQLTRRVRVLGWEWEWEPATHFVNNYGPSGPDDEEYECFGFMGMFVGFFCAVAFLLLPFVAVLFCFHVRQP